MITTPLKVLEACSRRLNESETDTSAKRMGIFNDAMKHVLAQYRWEWAKKKGNLTVNATDTEYVMTTAFADYDITWGIDSVTIASQVFPVEYDDRAGFINQHFSLTPDKKTIAFTNTLEVGTVPIWYSAQHIDVTAASDNLNVAIPESALAAVVLYMKHLIHDGKRQRNDARNAILDFQEVIEQMTMQNSSTKAKYLANTRRNPLQFAGVRRTYANH